jgi:hypothetical protein
MKKPEKIGGNIPDGLAQKGKIKKLIEVETLETRKADEKQRRPFRQWSKKSANRTFFTKVVKKKK